MQFVGKRRGGVKQNTLKESNTLLTVIEDQFSGIKGSNLSTFATSSSTVRRFFLSFHVSK